MSFVWHSNKHKLLSIFTANIYKNIALKRSLIIFYITAILGFILLVLYSIPEYRKNAKYILSHFGLLPSTYVHIIEPSISGSPHDYSFKNTNLPVFNLNLSQDNYRDLDNQIPIFAVNAVEKSLQDFKWSYVDTTLDHNNNTYPVSVRFRGWFLDHYRLKHKKSWRVKVRKGQHLNGIDTFNIINPRTEGVIEDALQYLLLNKDGHFTLQQKLIHLRVNEQYSGIQIYLEQPDDMLFSRRNMPVGQIIGEDKMFFSEIERDNIENWTVYTGNINENNPLQDLIELFSLKNSPEFLDKAYEIIDVGQFANYFADAAITKKVNPSSHNYRFYFDPKKGLFQILPWYQHGYFYGLKNFNPDKRSNYLVLNDIAHGLFLDQNFLQLYQQLIWDKINGEYHPYVLNKITSDLVHATTPDILADSHMHNFSGIVKTEPTYLSNAQQLSKLDNIFANIKSFDKHVRNDISYANASINLAIDEENPNYLLVKIVTSSHVAPHINEICVNFKDVVSVPLDLDFYNSQKDEWSRAIVDSGQSQSCFDINSTLQADTYIGKHPHPSVTAGLFVAGFKPGTAVSVLAKPTSFEFLIKTAKSEDTFRLNEIELTNGIIKGINSVTGYDLNIGPEEVEKITLDILPKPKHYDYFYNGNGENTELPVSINQFNYFEASPGKRKWIYPNFIKPKPLTIKANTIWEIKKDLILPFGQDLIIDKGAKIVLDPGVSLRISGKISVNGTENDPVIFTSSSVTEPFGSIIITNNVDTLNTVNEWGEISHAKFIRGSNDTINDVLYLGALSITSANVKMQHLEFIDNRHTDALNVVYSDSIITNSKFINNADCIDYDFSSGVIDNNSFENCRDDAIDISYSNTKISNNYISGSLDKGLSIGEKSKPIIYNNKINDSSIGIAIKDLSEALVVENNVEENKTGIFLYVKKHEFGPPRACLINNNIKNNNVNLKAIHKSEVFNTSPFEFESMNWSCK